MLTAAPLLRLRPLFIPPGHCCVLALYGRVKCWGSGAGGALGRERGATRQARAVDAEYAHVGFRPSLILCRALFLDVSISRVLERDAVVSLWLSLSLDRTAMPQRGQR